MITLAYLIKIQLRWHTLTPLGFLLPTQSFSVEFLLFF